MQTVRTPDERFADLPDYPFAPHYVDLAGDLRLHYVDEGPRDGKPVLMLHGEPSWSYLYRWMIPVFAEAGYRAVAPDLIGFGKSDKPTKISDYSYQQHMDWMTAWLEAIDLRGITLICQDWGSLLGLRLAAENADRFDRIVVANGFLPTGDRDPGTAFKIWRAFATYSPVLPVGRIVAQGTRRTLSPAERAAYDAPYPSSKYKAGARAFPRLVPISPNDPAAPANREAWAALGRWEKPFLTLFGRNDPILGNADKPLQEHVPGAAGQPHDRVAGGHFVQEDAGEEIARRTVEWIAQAD
ncbi:haloalkane dehalogenase [Nocardioides marmorisolisilvae]|uniref:Haloalkane dehalogenase n=1 Tax=Nocardioides marmorisolisilvae TaxID=1542737 RepID=A0A3N0DWZ6_9ACTN|nr:haloalkane dehalogenase [Nocardioides marmorisolisilvae]RNL80142.1 alpha/beta fold hydrolase [Nocardioides marmorisolisilvae]